ncbi:MAG: lytic transglycosylase domain-containing protein [Bdellovibrionales bacterium]|nr:lytic transglycosylase domain-containing protein [Bdellovibrionales bacterium]
MITTTMQKQIRGILAVAAMVSCIGTALAATSMPVPVRKPAAAVKPAETRDIKKSNQASADVLRPRRKPQGAMPSMAHLPAAAASAAAASVLPVQRPSIFSRVFGHISAGKRLTDHDAARYAHIFAFQDVGDFTRADAEIAKLDDDRILGHVMYQRFMHPQYTARYDELATWMNRYADYPGAQKIRDLALRKRPAGAAELPAANYGRGVMGQQDYDVGQLAQPHVTTRSHSGRAKEIISTIRRNLSNAPATALRTLETDEARRIFSAEEYDSLRGDVAASYFFNGRTREAYEIASLGANRSKLDAPQAGWIAGLAAWKMGKYEESAGFFELTANSSRSSAWMSAAGAYWTARSYLRSHKPHKVGYWLRRSAEYPRTFYGIISLKALGMEQVKFNWEVPSLSDRHVKALSAVPAGRRALALVDAERFDLAELEMRQINPGRDLLLQESMIALATTKGMPHLAMRMGSAFRDAQGDLYDAALYPDAPWGPERGFHVDKALVYAFIRQESKFDPQVTNKSSGAQGLMQLMPATARHVANQYGEKLEDGRLRDPQINIDLGQKYLAELLSHDAVNNNLFKLAVAYNAGPGKLGRWQQSVRYEDDPLLFIESIPAAETRIFVERVLANYWIYRIKFGQRMTSLDNVVEGDWPLYNGQDINEKRSFAESGFFGRP